MLIIGTFDVVVAFAFVMDVILVEFIELVCVIKVNGTVGEELVGTITEPLDIEATVGEEEMDSELVAII